MSQMADREGTGDGHGLIPFIYETHVNAQDGLPSSTKSRTMAAPDTTVPITIIDAVLKSLPVSKQSQPPKIPPELNASHGDALVKGKGREAELQGKVYSASNLETGSRLLETGLKNIDPELVRLRVVHLQSQEGCQHQPRYKDLSSNYIRKAEIFIVNHGKFSLNKILSRETDLAFLQQLLDDIYSLDTEKVTASPSLTNPLPTGDPVLEFLIAASPCYRRENALLLAPILDDTS